MHHQASSLGNQVSIRLLCRYESGTNVDSGRLLAPLEQLSGRRSVYKSAEDYVSQPLLSTARRN